MYALSLQKLETDCVVLLALHTWTIGHWDCTCPKQTQKEDFGGTHSYSTGIVISTPLEIASETFFGNGSAASIPIKHMTFSIFSSLAVAVSMYTGFPMRLAALLITFFSHSVILSCGNLTQTCTDASISLSNPISTVHFL